MRMAAQQRWTIAIGAWAERKSWGAVAAQPAALLSASWRSSFDSGVLAISWAGKGW
jgi:hypothetical protein